MIDTQKTGNPGKSATLRSPRARPIKKREKPQPHFYHAEAEAILLIAKTLANLPNKSARRVMSWAYNACIQEGEFMAIQPQIWSRNEGTDDT